MNVVMYITVFLHDILVYHSISRVLGFQMQYYGNVTVSGEELE